MSLFVTSDTHTLHSHDTSLLVYLSQSGKSSLHLPILEGDSMYTQHASLHISTLL